VVRKMLMRNIRCWLVVLVIVLTFSVAGAPFCVFAVDEADAGSAIAVAEDGIVVCYRAVAGADEAGANVTGLLLTTNEAGDLLSRAKLAYKMGDFDSAVSFAVQSQEKLNGLEAKADVLRENAMQQGHWDFMVNVVGSIVGAVVVVCGGFVVWFLLKRRYEKVV
jgi:hypothetical protein